MNHKQNKGLEIRSIIRHTSAKIDLIPFITMKFLSDKQEKNQENLTEFQEQYGFTFRDYELTSNIIKKYDDKDESYTSDINSALNALKNSKNQYIRDIFNKIPEDTLQKINTEDILSLLKIEEDLVELYKFVNYLQISREANIKMITPPIIDLLAKIIQTNHDTTNIYDPTCRDAQTITAIKEFEHATVYEEDETQYSHLIQNLIINEIPLEKVTIHNREVLVDESDDKYDTIISVPPMKRGKVELQDPEKYEQYKPLNHNIVHLLNLIDHLDENGVLITTTSQDLLVKNNTFELRKYLIENNLLDSIIEYETGFRSRDITFLVIKKNKADDNFLFMKPEQLLPGLLLPDSDEQIIESYEKREIIPKFSNLISKEEIIKNEYNLNPKRYVYTLDYEEKTIEEVLSKQKEFTDEIAQLDEDITQLLEQLNE